jgi:tRNA threonylcarbamoyladenosine dehydratase
LQADKLLAKVRNILRRDYQFPKAINTKKSAKFGIVCVYSDEQVIRPEAACEADSTSITGLNCAGYGSSVCVTAPFGFATANLALHQLLNA